MTVTTASDVQVVSLPRSTSGAMWSLALREGRRMVTSPAIMLLLGLMVLVAGIETVVEATTSLPHRYELYDGLVFFTALYLGLLMYVAAHLVTSSARRTKAERQLAASALSARHRTGGLCLGVLVGPGVVGLVIAVTLALLGNDLGPLPRADSNAAWAGVSLVQLALTLVGGAMFGVMWATWLRFPGSLPLGFIALMFLTLFLADSQERAPVGTWPWFMPYVTEPEWTDEAWTAGESQHLWHAVYMVGLCALAFCGAMLRERDHRGRWIAISAVTLLAVVVTGVAQVS